MDTQSLSAKWAAKWPDQLLINRLAVDNPRVRFYTLDDGKRYATSENERRIILDRHNALLAELASDENLIVITSWWNKQDKIDADSILWRTVNDEDVDEAKLYVKVIKWEPGVLDKLLADIADDVVAGVIIAPESLDWLYLPYDGGADVYGNKAEILHPLREKFNGWVATE